MSGHISTLSARENGGRGGILLSPQALTVLIAGINLVWGMVFGMFMLVRSADIKAIEEGFERNREALTMLTEETRVRLSRLESIQDSQLMNRHP